MQPTNNTTAEGEAPRRSITAKPTTPRTKTKLKPNTVYMLVRDVKNPRPDRRVSHDWRSQTQWLAGMRFKTTTFRFDDEITLLSFYNGRYTFQDFIADKAPAGLVDALEPVQATVDEELEMLGALGYKSEAIDLLIEQRIITREQLIDACKAAHDAEVAE